jgi:glucose/mannose transport system permease protein
VPDGTTRAAQLPGRVAAGALPATRPALGSRIAAVLPHLVMWPPLLFSAAQVLTFSLWTGVISFTPSTLLPDYDFIGFANYTAILANRSFKVGYGNLMVFGFFFVTIATGLGLLLAILIDQRIRTENLLRTIFLYPMAVSFVVTGTVWQWLLNPGLGIQKMVVDLGWTGFRFDWLIDRDMAIYCIVLAGVWQSSGFAMALFLAGIRSVDADLFKAAAIDGASAPRIYLRVVLPTITPILIAVLVILLQFAIKTFDLVRALTAGGPGIATTLPALVVYDFMFQRGQLGRGSAAAVLMLGALLVVIVPWLLYKRWVQMRAARND